MVEATLAPSQWDSAQDYSNAALTDRIQIAPDARWLLRSVHQPHSLSCQRVLVNRGLSGEMLC